MSNSRPEECDIPAVEKADAPRRAKQRLEIPDSGINIRGLVHETKWGMSGAMQDTGLSLEGSALVDAAHRPLYQVIQDAVDPEDSLSE